ncbi:family 61 glycosyl hydrolase [Colletotrichum navitas]|uniref:lytic cellulose monooxygenase (C4-dehydrogenating) n=1 Tax=Colletotrichum navitas TaxID=681940 RepID=A0AAD8PK68_9PEZI|nr:family 61 glycosyl hydrolase [Colletotrichum navitas]KAK1566302.1 family 61 glycosyl hydrolase [Colletotrichum navitas]
MRHVVFILAGSTGLALGHSRVLNFVVDGASYEGFNPQRTTPKALAAWGTSVKNDGWIGTESYGKPDIVCHTSATNARAHVPVTAGTTIGFQWQGWPESHHGPVLTYLAYCGEEAGSCEAADKTRLNFFAIDKVGLVDPEANATSFATAWGTWATDILIQNNATWTVQIPPKVVPGHYVLRHEIIALHYARVFGQGAQHYPQCVNIEVVGEGNVKPSGTLGTHLYRPAEEGLVYDISQSPTGTYNIPGPTVYAGERAFVSQTGIVVKYSATAIIPGGAVSTGT